MSDKKCPKCQGTMRPHGTAMRSDGTGDRTLPYLCDRCGATAEVPDPGSTFVRHDKFLYADIGDKFRYARYPANAPVLGVHIKVEEVVQVDTGKLYNAVELSTGTLRYLGSEAPIIVTEKATHG